MAQKGEAAEIRNSGTGMGYQEKVQLHQIVHSADRVGKYANTPNPYRDLTNSYDPEAEKVLQKFRKQ